jgi:hypothetical protein
MTGLQEEVTWVREAAVIAKAARATAVRAAVVQERAVASIKEAEAQATQAERWARQVPPLFVQLVGRLTWWFERSPFLRESSWMHT